MTQAYLVEPAALAEEPDVRVVDCREAASYARGHVPGAVHLAIDPWLKEYGRSGGILPSTAFCGAMGRLGIDARTSVVAYDDVGSLFAARLWWVLRHYGHERVRLVDGGWQRWLHEGHRIETEPVSVAPRRFVPGGVRGVTTREDVMELLGRPGVVLLDVRRPDEWSGDDAYGNRRVGHLPGAAHMLWSDVMTQDAERRFRAPTDMRAILAQRGVTPDREVLVYCQAAIRAAHTAFVLGLLGFERVLVYEASMAEWANRDDTPLVMDGPPPTAETAA